ncbi:hypothetical protein SH467x_002235 [Pirellulaceae bacterium SH467]
MPEITQRLDKTLSWIAFASVFACLFLPMLLISYYVSEEASSLAAGTAEATVGVGVVLRAIARRLFRAGASNVARLTFGTMTRALSRTAISRVTKLVVRGTVASELKGLVSDRERPPLFATTFLAVLVGLVATVLSFWGGVQVTGSKQDLTHSLPVWELALWSALPLLVLSLTLKLGESLFGATCRSVTGIDGLILQAYFTLSGSFLPMTTDFHLQGTARNQHRSAVLGISILLVLFLALKFVSGTDYRLEFIGSMFLTYAFVYSFPVNPLLGHTIWCESKPTWFALFLVVLGCFLFLLSEEMSSLL